MTEDQTATGFVKEFEGVLLQERRPCSVYQRAEGQGALVPQSPDLAFQLRDGEIQGVGQLGQTLERLETFF